MIVLDIDPFDRILLFLDILPEYFSPACPE